MRKFIKFAAALGIVFNITSVQAQTGHAKTDAVTEVVDIYKTPDLNYNDTSKKLQQIEKSLKSGQVTLQEMSDDVKFLEAIRGDIESSRKQVEQELQFVQKRIDALGEEPKEGEKELEVIARKRAEFNKEASFQKGRVAEADILMAKIDELYALILNIRNQELLGNLIAKRTPLYYPHVFFGAAKQFVEFFFDIVKSPVKWYQELDTSQKDYVKSNVIPVALIVLFCSWLGVWLRLFIMRKFGYKKEIEHPRYGMKVFAAVFVAIAYGVIPATIIIGFLLWMMSTKVLTFGFFGLVLSSVLYYSLYVVLAQAFSRVTFAPYNEKWRLVNVNNEKAKRITSALYISAVLIGISAFLEHIAVEANYNLELDYFITVLSCAVKAFCIILIVKRLLWDEIEDVNDDEEGAEVTEDEGLSTAFKVTFFVSMFAVGVFLLSVFGYPKLSAFILNRFILSVIAIGLFIVLRKALGEVLHRVLLLRFWVKTFKMRRRMISKIDFWMSLIIDPLLALLVIFVLLSLWGVSTDLLMQSIKKLFFGFTIGGVKISLISIFLGIGSFFISIALVKALRRRLNSNVLDKMDIDDGIRHSLSSGFSFFGFIIAAIIAITMMGGNLTNLALIAGALSFGIGLGLQNIVNNFVSGIIILFERPIKVGDWVIINGEEGLVKQINIRATEIETWKKASVIIPNADLLSNTVKNLTHDDKWGRLEIEVGVSYGTDLDRVKTVLLEIARDNKRVMKKPEPYVIFRDFGDSYLAMELRCYTADIMNGLGISSDLRFEIYKRFADEGIEIPFPQKVVYLKTDSPRELKTILAKE